jgi:CRISPR-associated protein Cas5t
LTDLRLWVWLDIGKDSSSPDLPALVAGALDNPSGIKRSGGLSLGESSYLVDSISMKRAPPGELIFVRPDPRGFHYLRTWVDHIDESKSRSDRFSLTRLNVSAELERCFINLGF